MQIAWAGKELRLGAKVVFRLQVEAIELSTDSFLPSFFFFSAFEVANLKPGGGNEPSPRIQL